jgi:hypothetical protein
MSDAEDQVLSDEALGQALTEVARRQAPSAAFRQRLGERLRDSAAPPPVPVPRRRRPMLAACAALAGAALALALIPRAPSLAPVTRTLPADQEVTVRAPAGKRAGVALGAVARLELRDGAEVRYRPGTPPRLELALGYLRVVAAAPLQVLAAGEALSVEPRTDVALELRDLQKGDRSMRPLWLIPTSAGSGAALTLAVLVASGHVALHRASASTIPPPGEVLVMHPASAPGPHRLAELEQKVSALKLENGRLAGQLARTKGVTVEQVHERIAGLARTPLGGLLAPGALADLVTDLKGLGPAGVEAMIKLLGSPSSSERFLAAKLLEDLNAPAAIDALKRAALTEKEEMNANMASHALAFTEDPAVVPALREIADQKDGSWGSQVNALWGLCKRGDRKAIDEALAWMKDDKRPPQQRAALGANLMLLPDPELMPIVDRTLQDFGNAPQVATFAATYYQNVGTPEGRERLQSMARDPKLPESARKAAQQVLAAPAR